MPANSKTAASRIPWGGIAGLLSACLMTLLGVVLGHEPDTILMRAVGGGLAIGLLVKAATVIARNK